MSKKFYKEFISHLASLKGEKAVSDFLGAILTPKEKEDLGKRLQIVKMLKDGIPQREIADTLGVGIATVTRGAREIKLGNFKKI